MRNCFGFFRTARAVAEAPALGPAPILLDPPTNPTAEVFLGIFEAIELGGCPYYVAGML
jgi:hypothetical protein